MATVMPEIQQRPESSGIMDRAVCLSLEIHKPGNRRKVSSSQVETDADKSMINVSKLLLDSAEYKAISRHDGEVRQWLYSRALPGPFRAGVYLIPHELVLDVDTHLREAGAAREELIDAFMLAYPSLESEAAAKLGSLYDPKDYPEESLLRAAFSVHWSYFAFQTPDTLRRISTQLFERERDKAAASWVDATKEVREALRAGFAELVDHMAERLTGDKVFRNSLVENFRDFLSTFDFRNITDDADLRALVTRAGQLLDGVNPDTLRKEEGLRDAVARGMAEINASLDTMIVNRPKRRLEIGGAE